MSAPAASSRASEGLHPARARQCRALAALVIAAAVGTAAAAQEEASPAAFLDQLLPRARAEGAYPYRARPAKIDGVSYPRSLMTEAASDREQERATRLSLPLEGRYARFAATVGRDDAEASRGSGLALFEVVADGRTLYRSAPLRSSRTPVRVPPGVAVRAAPEQVRLDVRGVRTLQLVTRFATDVPQDGTMVRAARGCVWGDARLYGPGGIVAATPPAGAGAPDGGAHGVRAALRLAALRAAAALRRAPNGPPLRLAVAPLSAPRDFPGGGRRADELVRLLREQAAAVRVGSGAVFAPLDRGAEGRFQRAMRGRDPADESAAVAAAARGVGAEALLVPALLPPSGQGEWRLEVRISDLRRGAANASLPPVIVSIPAGTR